MAQSIAASAVENRDIIIGRHVYANLYDVDPAILWDEEYLKKIVLEAVEKSNTTLAELKTWRVGGKKGGISIIALVLESHIALHTWPEYRYATLDIYTCGEKGDPWAAFRHIVSMLKPGTYTVRYADRSSISPLAR